MGFVDSVINFLKKIEFLGSIWDFLETPTPENPITVERQGADKPIPVIYGTRKVGAIKVHKYVTDTPEEAWNDLLHLICVFSEGEVDGLETLYFNGVKSTDEKFIGGRLNGKWFSVDFFTGEAGQPASAAAVSGIPNWTIDHRLDGLCYAYIVLQMPDPEAQLSVWRGEPQVQAVIRGKKVLDTRTGLTEYSENPAMCLRDYLTNPIYGKGLASAFMDDQSIETIANACDQTTSNTITTTEYTIDRTTQGRPTPVSNTTTTTVEIPRFALNTVIDNDNDYMDNVNQIMSSFRGIVQDMTGSAKFAYETTIEEQYGVNELPFVFTQDDIIGEVEHDSGSIDKRHNLVEVRFPSDKKDYETDSVFFPDANDPLRAQWLDEDGGKQQEQSIKVDSITTKAEALQLAEIAAKRSRFNKTASFTGMPWTIQVEVGDVVGLDSEMNGWSAKPFRVIEKKLNGDDTVDFTLREHEDAVYPWSGRSFDETIGGTWLGDPDDLAPPEGLTLTQDPTLSRTGTLEWQTTLNAFVRRYEVKIIGASGTVFDVDVLGNAWDVPLLDAGDYTAEVYAVSTVGARSGASALAFTLAAPVAPTSLSVTPRDWELEVAPQLAGIGLGTVFEFDIVAGDGTGYTPSSRGRASTFTFTGLLPDTLYTVYARSVNAYGVSGWTSASATTTNTGEQIDPYLDTIRDELDNLETEFSTFDPSSDWKNTVQNLLSEVGQDVTEIFERREDVNTEKEQRIQQFEQIEVEIQYTNNAINTRIDEVEVDISGNATAISGLQLEVNDLESDLTSIISRVDQVEIDSSDNATAISGLQGQVNDPVNNTSALYQFVQTAQTTADGNATSITAIENDVYDASTGLSATNTIAQRAQIDANDNASTITDIYSGVTGESGEAAALARLQAYQSEGGLGARAFFGTDVNNRVTGIIVNDDGTNRQIEFQSDTVVFLDGNSQPMIYFDNTEGRYVFDGEIVAQAGSFTGTVTSATISASNITGGSINIGNGTFAVDNNGNMVANSGTFGGSLDAAGGSFNGVVEVIRGGNRVRIDPANDLMLWFGNNTIGVANQSKQNGEFWIASDGTFSSTTYRKSTRGAFSTDQTYSVAHKTVKGECDTDFFAGIFSIGSIPNVQSVDGREGTLTVRIKEGGTTIFTQQLPVDIYGNLPNVISASTRQPVSFSAVSDNTSLSYYSDKTYAVEFSLSLPITYSQPTSPVMSAQNCVLRTLEIRDLNF
ncbi:MAG: putative tip attachment protein J [Prokaryotic dsDNA virus sp.]|nr:MAG: putative tip attachment protein J [Prokaryotic dsDNA virus sp.]|tara:strand:- start:19583 stop:23257 length:3675 start_codon:yes stop_codon:yes gene_type:complete